MTGGLLLATWEGGGTVTPMAALARRLMERGHEVTMLADPTVARETDGLGCRLIPWQRAPHRTNLEVADDLFRDWEIDNPVQLLGTICDRLLVGPTRDYAADTACALREVEPAALVTNSQLFGAIAAAQAQRVKVAAVVPNIWMVPEPGLPPVGPGWLPRDTWWARLRDFAAGAMVTRVFDRALPDLNRFRSELGLGPLDTLFDQVRGADAILVQSSAAFDYASRRLPPKVRYVGPVVDDPAWAGPWTPPWPASNTDPLVLVAFSSTFQNQGALLRRVVAALAQLPVRAVVTLGEMLPAHEVQGSGSVAVVQHAPHGVIVDDASLVITHAGHGITMKALAAGVPLVCLPMGRDQPENAARVVVCGAGVRLSPHASCEAIRDAATRVLHEPHYRHAAQHMARRMAAEARDVDVVAEIETLAFGGSPDAVHQPSRHGELA